MTNIISTVYVPPAGPMGAKILIVGESPGESEEKEKTPFVGKSGQKLFDILLNFGVRREEVRIANLCNYRPLHNKFDFLLDSPQLSEGIEELQEYILKYPPNIIISLGERPLQYLTGRYSISKHRGSVLSYVLNPTIKVFCTYHPAFILRNPDLQFLFAYDLKRGISISHDTLFPYKIRNITVVTSENADSIVKRISSFPKYTIDIETYKKNPKQIICVGFGVSDTQSYVFPYISSLYNHISTLCYATNSLKIFHFGFCFDIIRLALDDIRVSPPIEDTYILTHAINPTLQKGLDFLTSIYTWEPYYKTQGRNTLPGDSKDWGSKMDKEAVYEYNGKDCCVQYEVYEALKSELTNPNDIKTYNFEIEDAYLALKIGENGLPFDKTRKELLAKVTIDKWTKRQSLLTLMVGREVNVNSSPAMKKLVYDQLALPIQKLRKGNEYKVTTNDDALVKLIGICQDKIDTLKTQKLIDQWKFKQGILLLCKDIRECRKLLSSYLMSDTWDDERIKAIYNVAATDTGRWGAMNYIDGSGFNPQTMPRLDIPVTEEQIQKFNEIPFNNFVESNLQESVDSLIKSFHSLDSLSDDNKEDEE